MVSRAALDEHWRASEAADIDAEHAIYATDAILDYPQSGERFRGREAIAAQRGGHPSDRASGCSESSALAMSG